MGAVHPGGMQGSTVENGGGLVAWVPGCRGRRAQMVRAI